jgi:signal transduction histidine kinase
MLSEILVALVVVTVAFLVSRDFVKTKSEVAHPDADGYSYPARRGAAGPGHSRAPDVFSDSAGSGAGLPAGDPQQLSAGPRGADATAGPETGRHHVRSRLALLALVPAVAVAVIALCVARIAASSSHHSGASASAVGFGVAAAVVFVVAVWLTVVTARSVLRPLYRLRTQALEAASGRPPATGAHEHASDEIGDISRAFDQMGGELARLAGNEAGLRGKLDAMFVNLSHRGRSLAERQMRLLDSLQRAEQDRDRLAGLVRVNRLAARMHRTSQNLLVLAGHEVPGGWSQPAALADVVRAAVSEIEEHERITLYTQPDIAVTGPAVGDVVNILAELIQNATSFSSADMPVEISSRLLNEGGVLIAITDRGVGMTAKELAYANWQLEHPPGTDIDVPKSVGLIVVARLAARHGVRTRLQQAEFGGLTAQLWLPEEVITRQMAMPSRVGGAGQAGSARGAHEAAIPAGAAALRQDGFMAPADDVAIGRRLVSEAGRRPGPAWTAMGARQAAGTQVPGSQLQGTQAAATQAPATQVSGTQVPGTQVPGTPAWETPAPRMQAAGTQVSGAQVSGTPAWETPAPENPAQAPGTPVPATGGGDTRAPAGLPFRSGQLARSGWNAPGATGTPLEDTSPVAAELSPPGGRVIVPSVEPPEDMRRLPIFDSVESSWFGSDRSASASEDTAAVTVNRWSSPADEGWRAAENVEAPTSGGETAAGLPKRLPNANLVPGAIKDTQSPELPVRSPAAVRDRLARFQRGTSEGRAAASEANPGQDEQA